MTIDTNTQDMVLTSEETEMATLESVMRATTQEKTPIAQNTMSYCGNNFIKSCCFYCCSRSPKTVFLEFKRTVHETFLMGLPEQLFTGFLLGFVWFFCLVVVVVGVCLVVAAVVVVLFQDWI